MGIRYEKTDIQPIYVKKDVKLKKAGTTFEITDIEGFVPKQNIQKLSKDEYMVLRTGEVRQYNNKAQSRIDSITSLKRTMAHARDMINANCTNPKDCLFITLTYRQRNNPTEAAVPMTDTHKLYDDLNKFYKKFNYKYGSKKASDTKIRRITCCEPQGSGSWHAHIIYIFDNGRPYIPAEDIEAMWGNGFIKIEAVNDNIDNVGAYLIAYMTDITTEELQQAVYRMNPTAQHNNENKGADKKILKGQRLYLYPAYFNPFRFSRNCLRPTIKDTTYNEALDIIGDSVMTYAYATRLTDDQSEFEAVIQHLYFKKKGGWGNG